MNALRDGFRVRLASVGCALRRWPTRRQWLMCGGALVGYGVVAGAVGMVSGFFRPGWPTAPAGKLVLVALVLLVTPSFLEELFFRVVLLPHPRECTKPRRIAAAAGGALIAFVLWHPLNGLLKPSVMPLFADPIFLALAALMGATCTACYLMTGSIWPPVLVHWVTVLVWVLLLDGGSLLGRPTT